MDFLKLIDDYQDEIIKSTQEIISIKSVEEDPQPGMPFGEGPFKALEYALELGENLGMEAKRFDGYAGHIDYGNGEEVVGVLAHVDVVPEGEGWSFDPYGGEISEGRLYGRGTTDDKGPAIAVLYAMKALKESGVDLKRKLRLILGANEETGWGCMDHYFKYEKAPDMGFTPDAEFPAIYGEKGIISFELRYKLESKEAGSILLEDLKGGNAHNMVPDNAMASIITENFDEVIKRFNLYKEMNSYPIDIVKEGNHIKVIAKGKSAHGSTPEKGENAITYLMDFLGFLVQEDSPLKKFISLYNEKLAFKHNGEGIGCGFEDKESGKLNFNTGVMKLDGDDIVLTINIRYPIESSSQEVYDGIRKNIEGTGMVLVEGNGDMKPLYVSKDDFLVKKLMNVYREQTGDMDSQPITIGGGTYARAMKNAVAFGPMFPGQVDVAHQKDEYISVEHLMQITKIYAKALYELAK